MMEPAHILNTLVPRRELDVERRRAQVLVDGVTADLSPWDERRFRGVWKDAEQLQEKIAVLDWVRRCHAREPARTACARAHATVLQTLRFPWLALVCLSPFLEEARKNGRLDLGILEQASAALLAVGRTEEVARLLEAVRDPAPPGVERLRKELAETRPANSGILRFPGPGPGGEPTPFPTDAIALLIGWLEAVDAGEALLANRLVDNALLLAGGPGWAQMLERAGLSRTPSPRLWPPLGLSKELVEALEAAGKARGEARQVSAYRAMRVLLHLASLRRGDDLEGTARTMIGHIRDGWLPELGAPVMPASAGRRRY